MNGLNAIKATKQYIDVCTGSVENEGSSHLYSENRFPDFPQLIIVGRVGGKPNNRHHHGRQQQ